MVACKVYLLGIGAGGKLTTAASLPLLRTVTSLRGSWRPMGSIKKLIARSSVAFTMKSPADGGFLILPPPWNSTQPPVEVSTGEIFFELTSGYSSDRYIATRGVGNSKGSLDGILSICDPHKSDRAN